ncbi:MAG: response regulator transcription factor [Chloroflexi bacterium]|nr:response regulator transcription factor [Chloroflexota bacterium]
MSLSAEPRLKLVLVDDHELARAALAKRLRQHEQIVVAGHTADPLEAHEIVRTQAPHVVLVDTVREDGQGANILSSLSALPAPLRPVLVVHLSYYQPEVWDVARAAGAHDLILKQIAVDVLAVKLFQAAHRVLPRDRWPAIATA